MWHPLNTVCPTRGLAVERTPRGIGVRSSDVLRLMSEATYTLCPAGDAPDSPRVYSALAHGSIPLIDSTTSLPPLADWRNFSVRIRFADDGSLVLPSPQRERELQHGAWAARRAFECEPTNPLFAAYVERSLGRIVSAHQHQERTRSSTRTRRRRSAAQGAVA